MLETENKVFDYIIKYKRINDGIAPSLREIGYNCGISSVSMVKNYLDRLAESGKIEAIPGKAGGIKVIGGQWIFEDGNEKKRN